MNLTLFWKGGNKGMKVLNHYKNENFYNTKLLE